MNNIHKVALQFVTYDEKVIEIRDRLIQIRKNYKISQKELAKLSNVSYGSIRRFESTGEISFSSLVKIAVAMRLYDDLDRLFKIESTRPSIEHLFDD